MAPKGKKIANASGMSIECASRTALKFEGMLSISPESSEESLEDDAAGGAAEDPDEEAAATKKGLTLLPPAAD